MDFFFLLETGLSHCLSKFQAQAKQTMAWTAFVKPCAFVPLFLYSHDLNFIKQHHNLQSIALILSDDISIAQLKDPKPKGTRKLCLTFLQHPCYPIRPLALPFLYETPKFRVSVQRGPFCEMQRDDDIKSINPVLGCQLGHQTMRIVL